MQFKTLDFKKSVILVFMLSSFFSCEIKSNLANNITIVINSIDKTSKQPRINMFDTVEISEENGGFLKKKFKVKGKYLTDSSGSVAVKIDPAKICDIYVKGLSASGGTMFMSGRLIDRQEVTIELISYKND